MGDLPDVSLQIPEETRPEVKALIKANVLGLRSAKAPEQAKAAQMLGELGEQGKPVRGLLCLAMLDPVPAVQVAAADALKSIDPKMQYLALALVTEQDPFKRSNLLGRIAKLGDDGEPLLPLVAKSALLSARSDPSAELVALSHIAKNDPWTCNLITSALDHRDHQVRGVALNSLARMKHGRRALSKVIALLNANTPENRIAAIRTLTALAEETTEEVIVAAIHGQRFHPKEEVRQAVDVALNKLQNKKP